MRSLCVAWRHTHYSREASLEKISTDMTTYASSEPPRRVVIVRVLSFPFSLYCAALNGESTLATVQPVPAKSKRDRYKTCFYSNTLATKWKGIARTDINKTFCAAISISFCVVLLRGEDPAVRKGTLSRLKGWYFGVFYSRFFLPPPHPPTHFFLTAEECRLCRNCPLVCFSCFPIFFVPGGGRGRGRDQ